MRADIYTHPLDNPDSPASPLKEHDRILTRHETPGLHTSTSQWCVHRGHRAQAAASTWFMCQDIGRAGVCSHDDCIDAGAPQPELVRRVALLPRILVALAFLMAIAWWREAR